MDKQFATSLLKELVTMNTVNPPGNEKVIAEKLRTLFEKNGIETELVTYEENRLNLIARLKGEESGPHLGFSGHMDTVPVGDVKWEHQPFEAEEENGRIYGRGSCDMKGGLAACVLAMLSLKEQGLPKKGQITLLATVGEEVAAVGAKQLTELGYLDDLDALIIAEPTNNNITTCHKGALWPQIITYGKTSHGSMPEAGVNAVLHMHEIISRIMSNEFQMEYEEDELLGSPTCSVNVIHGGSGTNVVPDRCSANIDIRTVPSQKHENIIKRLERLLLSVKTKYPDLEAEIKLLNDLPPLKTSSDDPFVKMLQDTLSEHGKPTEIKGITAYTDASKFVQVEKDLPIVILGPGDMKMAHQPDEYIELDSYFESIDLFQRIAQNFTESSI
ncbi:M20 family metallopeptidase [Alteribacillus iranensis]|uniref:Probable succinyl-diaminopimelate desuccinylase n=1 Tax=Alteribacillus iranensis TaxID=930128 RepID=A0A1I2DTN7_9BACI|nr:M20 family metallopeptidase [Alteribacillus iranensis]SFE84032.1 succinyl-diaminopimelate desuccinylase [Alteribacillus iranensis]